MNEEIELEDLHVAIPELHNELYNTYKLNPKQEYRPICICKDKDEQEFVVFRAHGDEELRLMSKTEWLTYFRPIIEVILTTGENND